MTLSLIQLLQSLFLHPVAWVREQVTVRQMAQDTIYNFKMKTEIFTLALLGAASAQKLTSLLGARSQTGDITDILSNYPAITQALASAKGITIFLPKDGARGLRQLNTGVGRARTTPAIEAALTYHVAKGVFPAAGIPVGTTFVETLLAPGNYSQVTGGQRLKVTKTAKGVTVQGAGAAARVVTPDIKFDGGVIHLIDAVLTVPSSAVATAQSAGLTALVKALSDAKLAGAIEGARDITIFAPTNAAFKAAGSVLAKASAKTISDALQYHVVKGVGFSTNLREGLTLPTLQGGSVRITLAGGPKVNGVKIVKTDILVKQGVVHVIDGVLLPK